MAISRSDISRRYRSQRLLSGCSNVFLNTQGPYRRSRGISARHPEGSKTTAQTDFDLEHTLSFVQPGIPDRGGCEPLSGRAPACAKRAAVGRFPSRCSAAIGLNNGRLRRTVRPIAWLPKRKSGTSARISDSASTQLTGCYSLAGKKPGKRSRWPQMKGSQWLLEKLYRRLFGQDARSNTRRGHCFNQHQFQLRTKASRREGETNG